MRRMRTQTATPDDTRGQHGGNAMPGLRIDDYGLALPNPEGDGFLGDLASQTAFRALLDDARRHRRIAPDPFDGKPSEALKKNAIDHLLIGGPPAEAHVVHMAIEAYAERLAHVVRTFVAHGAWQGVEAIVMGGGMSRSEFGRLGIARARRILRDADEPVKLKRLRHDPDDAALLGWAALLPADLAASSDAMLAVDVGGTNLRCGLIAHGADDRDDGSRAEVLERMHWRHADDEPSRRQAIDRLAGMLNGLIAQARTLRIPLAPFVGIAIPGAIEANGCIATGAHNLPGDWEAPFDLPAELGKRLDPVDGTPPRVVLHNDAVVQGLSERRRMRKYAHWGVMTIGTGLGNAVYRATDLPD
jgi:hypothetical protein